MTCPYRGVAAEGGLWARLEAVGMSVEMTAGVLAARAVEGMRFVLGPTMAFRRETIQRMGGFKVAADYHGDDFVLGNDTWKHGETVVLSHHVIDHMVINSSFWASMKHQVRWMKSTRFSRPAGHLGTSLTFSEMCIRDRVYNIEKMLKDSGEKVQAADKTDVESALAEAKKTLEGTPSSSDLKAAHEKLTQASHKLAEVLYKANAAAAGGPGTGAPLDGAPTEEAKKDEGVIDAEYVDVEEKK